MIVEYFDWPFQYLSRYASQNLSGLTRFRNIGPTEAISDNVARLSLGEKMSNDVCSQDCFASTQVSRTPEYGRAGG